VRLIVEIALTHVRGRTRQTVLSALGVVTGVGFAIAMAALMQGSQQDFINRVINASPHVTVKDEYRHPPRQPVQSLFPDAAVALTGLKPEEEVRGIRNPKPKVAAIDALPGVAAASTLRGPVVIHYGGKDVSASLIGIEPEEERRVSDLPEDMIVGSLDDLYTSANAIIIGEGLAEKLGARRGSTLSVSSPAGVLLKMKVVGLFRSGISSLDKGTGYTLLKKAEVLFDRPNVINEIRIRMDDVEAARDLAWRIESRLGYRTESWQEANQSFLEVFVIRNAIMYTVVGAIILVASFGIFNIISTITYEKARDIAILKSLGFREQDIRMIFLLEGLVIGIVGTLLGWALGYGLCKLLGTIQVPMRGLGGSAGMPVIYEPLHYLIAGVAAVGAAGIAGYLPARRAAKLNPVDIIRGAA
jgi:lipoprotein-releasing system permease protein